jgi:two-component system response regulator PilR (NtrC family)
MDGGQRKGYILIVDDEPTWRDFSHETLTKDGYEVQTAGALGEALSFLRRDVYDLIVIDSDLLEPEEKELLDNLIARCKRAHLIVMSAPSSRTRSLAESRRAFKLGVDDWITKPMGRSTLLNLIKSLLPGQAGGI